MSKSELQSDGTIASAAASRLRCAKKVLDIHRQFIDDPMTRRVLVLWSGNKSAMGPSHAGSVGSLVIEFGRMTLEDALI